MERRRLLGLVVAGALGGAGVVGSRRPLLEPTRREEPKQDIEPTSSGLQRIIWSLETTVPATALTFDDGPDPEFTPRILDILARYDVKATFMLMAHNAIRHPRLLRRVLAEGHEIGGHGWNHLNLTEVGIEELKVEIEEATARVEDLAEKAIKLFRPPYGRFSQAAVQLLGSSRRDLVVWSVTRGDLSWIEPGRVSSHVVSSAGPGDIVDLHDGIGRGTFNRGTNIADRLRLRREVEVAALPHIIEGIRAKGLEPVTISDLLARDQSLRSTR